MSLVGYMFLSWPMQAIFQVAQAKELEEFFILSTGGGSSYAYKGWGWGVLVGAGWKLLFSLCVCMQQRMDAAIKRSLSLIIVWLGVGLVYQQRTAQVDNCR